MPDGDTRRELTGRVAIVTGAGGQVGQVIARVLAGAGAAVVVNYRKSAQAADGTVRAIEAEGGRALAVRADITIPTEVEAMVEAAVRTFGGIDILVNNASVRLRSAVTETTLETFRAVVSSVLDGSFLCTKACVPHMERRGGGTIVNVGGASGHSGVGNSCHLAAAKAGLAGMTGSLAVELAPKGITVNCIVPGILDTPRPAGRTAAVASHVPMKRPGRPAEIADFVRYLCGSGCRFLTGESIHVNGGHYVTIA